MNTNLTELQSNSRLCGGDGGGELKILPVTEAVVLDNAVKSTTDQSVT